jgi:hypothetical protein
VGLAVTVVGLICLIPLACLLVPIGWFVNVLVEQSILAMVTENLGMGDGFRRGFEVLRANLGVMILMWFILAIIGTIAGLLMGTPLVVFLGPALIGAVTGSETVLRGGFILTALCLVGYLPVLIVLGGILNAYIRSAWTLTYLRVTGKQAVQAAASM